VSFCRERRGSAPAGRAGAAEPGSGPGARAITLLTSPGPDGPTATARRSRPPACASHRSPAKRCLEGLSASSSGRLRLGHLASKRQIDVGGVTIGGGAPVAVQSMTKTETADYDATMRQIHAIADAGGDLVRCAVPRDEDVRALERIVQESPIPVIADIHFNYTLALKAIDAGAHCIRINPGNIGGHDKTGIVVDRARAAGVPMRVGVNSGSLPKHLHELERENPVEALVRAAVEYVELMEGLDFHDFKVSVKSTSVPNTIASNRLLSERIDYPLHLGITEAGTKWSGSLKSAVGLGTLLADGIGDTIRISLSTFHAEEEVKVAWEILKALKLRERGPVLIACPTCGRLQFDMDTVVAEIEERLRHYDDPIEVAVLGCAVNGIGEASHADFGITGAKNEGLIFAHGKPLRKVPQERLVDELFAEIDKSIDVGRIVVDERKAAEGAAWLERIEEENADELTPERIAAMEAAAASDETLANGTSLPMAGAAKAKRVALDEDASPTAGRRFTRA
jgi:(E)-4-hydroxy-3-methylbut-2-enyl-diphosphate synthase